VLISELVLQLVIAQKDSMTMVKPFVTNVITDVPLVTLPFVLLVPTKLKDLVLTVIVLMVGLMMLLHPPIVLKKIIQLVSMN
jgi:hypothetical protein